MISKPKILRSKKLGTSAEAEIKGRLSYFSILAKPEPEMGIDFYCELLEGESPSSKFFGVQAKGTRHFKDCWRGSIKKTTIEHWLRLSFPVFLVVYDENSGNCYWMSIVHNLKSLIEKMQTNSRTISIKMDKSHLLEKGENKNDDLITTIKDDQAWISLFLGHPQFGEGYVRTLPIVYLPETTRINLNEGVRTNLDFLINHCLLRNEIETAYFLCQFLTRFDKAHYDHFVTFGRINKFLGKKEEAKKSFEEARRICKEDKNWNRLKKPSQPFIEEIIAFIEKEIANLETD